jgi:lipid II:glycine glycyltransferase (peptidoglycan interpeptide bridge formation enzyme)
LYYGAAPIAGALNFVDNPRVLQVFYVMMRYEFEHLRPAYALYDHVINYARANHFAYVDFGVSQDTKAADPMTPSTSLIRFKEHFGACGVMRSTLRWCRKP